MTISHCPVGSGVHSFIEKSRISIVFLLSVFVLVFFVSTAYPQDQRNRLYAKKKPIANQRTKLNEDQPITVIYVYDAEGKKHSMKFKGFNAECTGYSLNGIRVLYEGVSFEMPWKDIRIVFPVFGLGILKSGKTFETESIKSENCPGAFLEDEKTEQVMYLDYAQTKKVKVYISLKDIDVFAFSDSAIEEGFQKLAGIRAEQKAFKAKKISEGLRNGNEALKAEEYDRAATEFLEVMRLDPDNEEAKKGLFASRRMLDKYLEMVFVKGGCFDMGDIIGDGDSDEKPVHRVCLDSYYLDRREVSQKEYFKATAGNPSVFKGDDRPVENVGWNEAEAYCAKVGKRLPTEAEWEYAARGGGAGERYSGTSLDKEVAGYGWFDANSQNETHPVGLKKTNALGLFDMTGNVWEWTYDWYDSWYYAKSPLYNPQGPANGIEKVIRGGSWLSRLKYIRIMNRDRSHTSDKNNYTGFRCARN